jgi:hypothetical protein
MSTSREASIAGRPALVLACSAAVFAIIVAAMGLSGDGEERQAVAVERVEPLRTAPAPAPPITVSESGQQPRDHVPAIERALVSADAGQRETALGTLLPELLASEPTRAAALYSRLPPGDARDALRDEIARIWVRRDRESTMVWIDGIADEAERKAAAMVAVRALAAGSPADAIATADHFDVGRDDGAIEHIAQIWATEDPDAALRWLIAQPDDARNASTRKRVRNVLEERSPSR